MSTSEPVANIDFLSSIPSEILQASGPLGQAYYQQLALERAEQTLDTVRYNVERETRGKQPPLGMSDTEWVMSHPDVRRAQADVEIARESKLAAQAEVGGIVFLPAVGNLAEIEKRLATLNRKASKLGSEQITLAVSEEHLLLNYKTNDEDTRGYDFEHVFAILSGATPKVPGYEFLATITPTEGGNVVKRIPPIAYGVRHNLNWDAGDTETGRKISDRMSAAGQALEAIDLTRFHSTGTVCEHCHTDRQRNEVYAVYSEATGETIQVGRSCLRDFTGLNNPEKVLSLLEQFREFIRYASSGRGETPALPTTEFMTHCMTIARVEGGYKRGLGRDAVTNWSNRLHDVRDKRTNQPLWVEPTEYDAAQGAKLLTWAREEWDETSEFATNVKLSLAGEVMNRKLLGYAGAAVIAKVKWEERAEERAARAAQQAERKAAKAEAMRSEFIGQEKERLTLELTVTDIKWIADRYSYENATKPLIIMKDGDGNQVKWFASNLPAVADKTENDWPEVGGTYQVKGTVKRHEDSEDYGKATIITRCKFERTIREEGE